jgi:hypothetical protein
MHSNRINLTYKQYQNIVMTRWQTTLFWFAKKETEGYNLYFAKPAPSCVWLPGKPRNKYYKNIFKKINNQLRDQSRQYSFLTLTYSTHLYSQKSAFLLLKEHIREFFRLLRKRYKKFEYFWVVELTKNCYPHVHIIISKFIHWKVVRAIWHRVTKNKVVDIRTAGHKNVSEYLTKYLSKQSKHNETQFAVIFKNVDRLYGSSRNFFSVNKEFKKKEWFCISMSLDIMYPDWYLGRADRKSDFWFIPMKYASCLLWSDYISHFDRYPDYPEIYQFFYDQTSMLSKKLDLLAWKRLTSDPDEFEEIPF